jgi:AcrR family transcriptional regulator
MANEFFKKEPRQSRSRALVEALIQAAEQMIDRSGDLSAISAEGVARRAGVGIGSLYDYFVNGESVLGAFLQKITKKNFDDLEAAVNATRGQPLSQAIRAMSDATYAMYLERPNRTRGALLAIARLGWMMPVIQERDRFAAVLARRLREDLPKLDEAKALAACQVVCDAVMGLIAAQLWRPLPGARESMFHVACGTLERELGIEL